MSVAPQPTECGEHRAGQGRAFGGVGVVIYRCAKGLLSELPWFQKDHQMG